MNQMPPPGIGMQRPMGPHMMAGNGQMGGPIVQQQNQQQVVGQQQQVIGQQNPNQQMGGIPGQNPGACNMPVPINQWGDMRYPNNNGNNPGLRSPNPIPNQQPNQMPGQQQVRFFY